MRRQGRPAIRQTPLIVKKRVPIVQIGGFCQKYGSDIMNLLADFDNEPEENIPFSDNFLGWMKRLQDNMIPVYCKNRHHQNILNCLYRQYRAQGSGPNFKQIQISCFPKNIHYGNYECWYIHANKKYDICVSCRERLDEHLGKNLNPARITFDLYDQQNTQILGLAIQNSDIFENLPETLVKIEEPEKTEKQLYQVKIDEEPIPEEKVEEKKPVQQKPTSLFSTQTAQKNQQTTRKTKSIRKMKGAKRGVDSMEVIPEVKKEDDDSMSL